MNNSTGLYPDLEPFRPDRRAALRSTLISAIAAPTPRPWFRRRTAMVPVPLAAATLLALVWLAQPWATLTPAWAAVPERADAAATAKFGGDCSSAIAARHFPMVVEAGTPILAETRGKSTAVLLASATQVQICITDPQGSIDSLGVYQVGSFDAGGTGLVDGVPGSREGGNPLRVIFGRLAASDDKVVVKTADGLNVTASVAAYGKLGYFLAWWPSHADASNVTVTGASGATDSLAVPDQTAPSPVQQ